MMLTILEKLNDLIVELNECQAGDPLGIWAVSNVTSAVGVRIAPLGEKEQHDRWEEIRDLHLEVNDIFEEERATKAHQSQLELATAVACRFIRSHHKHLPLGERDHKVHPADFWVSVCDYLESSGTAPMTIAALAFANISPSAGSVQFVTFPYALASWAKSERMIHSIDVALRRYERLGIYTPDEDLSEDSAANNFSIFFPGNTPYEEVRADLYMYGISLLSLVGWKPEKKY